MQVTGKQSTFVSRMEDKKTEDVSLEYAPEEALACHTAKKREAALVRKLDCFIAPVMSILFFFSYLDRGNIGFAATQGMTEDINLVGTDLNTAVSVFYIFYILADLPASLMVKRLRFDRVIPVVTFAWGLVCLCTGFIQSFTGLVVIRMLLGFFEGCMFPSMTLMFCNWYLREELATRVGFLFIASALSGAFGGLLAWGILHMDGTAGYAGWRWLYILEGAITIIWAGACVFLVPKDYETAYFLNGEEKVMMKERAERAASYSGGNGHYNKREIVHSVKDVKSWVHGLCQACAATVLFGFSTFLPIIIKNGFHFSTVQAQYLVIPVNVWGAVICAIGAVLSDKYNARFLVITICAPFAMIGYAILLADVPSTVQYFATYLIAPACYLCTGTNIAWLSMNCAPDGKRAGSVGVLLTLTNVGGIIAGQIYQTESAPAYTLGHAWCLGSLVFAWSGWWLVRWIYTRREAWKEKMLGDGSSVASEDFTDRSPQFRYQM